MNLESMRNAARKPLLGLITLSMLSVCPAAFTAPTGEIAGQQSHFGPLGDAFESAHACNKAFTTWLISGIDGVASDLKVRTQSPGLDPSTLQAFRARLLADQKWFAGPQGVEPVLTQCLAAARAQIPVFEEAVRRAPAEEHVLDEQNLERFKREINRLEGSVQRMAAYAKRLADLDQVVLKRLSAWEAIEAGRGLEETRRQTSMLLLEQARKWESMGRREIADTLRSYDFQLPSDLTVALVARYRKVDQMLPRLLADISVKPAVIHPLLNDQVPQALAVSLETTCPADIKVLVSLKDGQNEPLQLTQVSPTRYEAAWPAPFLRDTAWQKALRKKQSVELGHWKLFYELRSNQIGEGYDLVTQSGVMGITAASSATHGMDLQAPPEKPSILRKYASEEDIPLTDEHHFLSFIYYPILGFPRDLIDAVFGVVDKVPYVSIPVEFVYAGPGKLICKPWWSDQYKPIAEQSAGYLSWDEWGKHEWEYFENARTWSWPNNPQDSLAAGVFYIGLGLPRDLIDVPFGLLDQIPYVSMPISYVYYPATVITKPWYAERYTCGEKSGNQRVPYGKQSKNVIGLTEWWDESRWVFFENFKTTTFRSKYFSKQQEMKNIYQQALAEYASEVRKTEQYNETVREAFIITMQLGKDTTGETR